MMREKRALLMTNRQVENGGLSTHSTSFHQQGGLPYLAPVKEDAPNLADLMSQGWEILSGGASSQRRRGGRCRKGLSEGVLEMLRALHMLSKYSTIELFSRITSCNVFNDIFYFFRRYGIIL